MPSWLGVILGKRDCSTQAMLLAKRALRWIVGKLKLLQSGIDNYKIGQIQSFLELWSYFRKFLYGYFTLVAPLTFLTQSKTKFILIKDCEPWHVDSSLNTLMTCVGYYEIKPLVYIKETYFTYLQQARKWTQVFILIFSINVIISSIT